MLLAHDVETRPQAQRATGMTGRILFFRTFEVITFRIDALLVTFISQKFTRVISCGEGNFNLHVNIGLSGYCIIG